MKRESTSGSRSKDSKNASPKKVIQLQFSVNHVYCVFSIHLFELQEVKTEKRKKKEEEEEEVWEWWKEEKKPDGIKWNSLSHKVDYFQAYFSCLFLFL